MPAQQQPLHAGQAEEGAKRQRDVAQADAPLLVERVAQQRLAAGKEQALQAGHQQQWRQGGRAEPGAEASQ